MDVFQDQTRVFVPLGTGSLSGPTEAVVQSSSTLAALQQQQQHREGEITRTHKQKTLLCRMRDGAQSPHGIVQMWDAITRELEPCTARKLER